MRFIDLFSGIGGFRRGMELAGNECVGFCEFDKYATASYTSMHLITDKQREYLSTLPLKERQKEILKDEYRNGEWYSNDIRTVHFADMPKAECLCFGAPCFVAGTLITTKRGNIPIEKVMIGDEVLTHTEGWHKVTDTMVHCTNETYTMYIPYLNTKIECTGNHPFYVTDNEQKEPHWKEVEDFTGDEKVFFPVSDIWTPIGKVMKNEQKKEYIPVYNLEVEEDHSYTANGVAVHNCQSFSVAGKRTGLEGQSGLIKEVFRILGEAEEGDRPEWLIYENVKGMLSSNRGLDYLAILSEMDRLGYDVQWQNIHSEWFVPQHRERIYTVGHLRRKGRRQVLPLEGTGREDSLEKVGSGIIPIGTTRPQMHSIGQIFTEESISPTLTRNDANQNQKLVAQGVIGFYKTSSGTVHQRGSVYGEDAPNMQTLSATDYKEPIRVACACLTPGREKKRQNGRRFMENGEPEFTLTAQDIHGVAVEEKPDKAVIDDTFGYDKNPRIYTEESPTLRSGRQELKVTAAVEPEVSEVSEVQKHGNSNMQRADLKSCYKETDGIYTKDGHYALWNEKYGCYMSIRKLTPKEYFHLQGWSDDYFEKAAFVNGDTQLYKQAGNGVTVQCVEAVADAINKADTEADKDNEAVS